MYNEVITLKRSVIKPDGSEQVKSRNVFCRMQSIGIKEFYQAYSAGLRPEIKFIIADYEDYDNENICVWKGVQYRILRTYVNGNELEITCDSEIGGGY